MQGHSSCWFAWISPVLLTEKWKDNSTIIGVIPCAVPGQGPGMRS